MFFFLLEILIKNFLIVEKKYTVMIKGRKIGREDFTLTGNCPSP